MVISDMVSASANRKPCNVLFTQLTHPVYQVYQDDFVSLPTRYKNSIVKGLNYGLSINVLICTSVKSSVLCTSQKSRCRFIATLSHTLNVKKVEAFYIMTSNET